MSTITQSIGRVLSGRYRIEAALGSGASAHVYVATDTSLRRQVAIKMLHDALAADGPFLRRFRAEAQAAASLTHPNLVAVYDWGEDAGGPFLVLEYLAGGSLRDAFDAEVGLDHAQIASIGRQAAQGLAFAHGRGFVHRDVKPANLLFDKEGRRLCVADFGLARALAEAAWTEPVGATLGTARYAAPEQALGRRVDDRADVYALALVLYEALTGEVPFSADTTIGTLMARVDAELPDDPRLGEFGGVLRAATVANPEQRLSAEDFAERLRYIADKAPAPSPVPVPDLDGQTRAARAGRDATNLAPVAYSTPPGTAPATSNGGAQGATSSPPSVVEGEDVLAVAEAVGIADAARTDPPTSGERRGRKERAAELTSAPPIAATFQRRRRRWPWLVAALVIVLAAGGVAAGLGASKYHVFTTTTPPSHAMPDLYGLAEGTAITRLAKDHIHLHPSGSAYSTSVKGGGILTQSPAAGIRMKEGGTVNVTISEGLPPAPIPGLTSGSVISRGCAQVRQVLAAANLTPKCSVTTSIHIPAGRVISYEPQSGALWHTLVTVVVSSGLPSYPVPNLSGLSQTAASQALLARNLVPNFNVPQVYSSSVPLGDVVSWTDAGQTVKYNTTITVTLSKGPAPRPIPDVYDDSLGTAEQRLKNDGFVVGEVSGAPTPPGPSATVVETYPKLGTVEPYGTTIDIIYVG